ncbi:hypothetical protein LQ948_13390 [Jiella sp. MQZ9-1]|uniref:Alpha/beta hydrolase n=1 Tax=Jiella flava TaxID=2816857 RepID=A0A939FZL1_9HYPH|nr:hypothetical protein [Jiella flava]MBO0663631.1 hypothetical protein [Jiella flava]MCD2472206.1 hypothetical protein [Jiella flava]
MTQTEDQERCETNRPSDFRRHVFYLHGFDPRGAGIYHGHFRDGLDAASRRWSRKLAITETETEALAAAAWTVTADDEASGGRVVTRYEMLLWTDIVRRYWFPGQQLRLALESFRFAFTTWRLGILKRFRRPAWALYVAILMTPALVVTAALVAALAVFLTVRVVLALVAELGAAQNVALAIAAGAAVIMLWVLARGWRRLKAWLNIWWVTRFLGYLRGLADGRFDRDEARAQAFAERIFAIWRTGAVDEILIVGHSLGAIFLVRAGARLLQRLPEGKRGPNIVLLALGHTVPLYTLLGGDEGFRQDLAALATSECVRFLDVTSGSDPGSSCRIPLIEGIDLRGEPSRVISREPDFHDSLEAETFRHIRMRPLDFHFQYLKPSERGAGFDYFELVTRPRPIETSIAQP